MNGYGGNSNPFPVQLYPVSYEPDGEQAIIDYSNIPSELPQVPGAPKGSRQFEVYNSSLALNGVAKFKATWRPEYWAVYLVTPNLTDQARVSQGGDPVQPAIVLQYRSVVILPGLDRDLAVVGQAITGTISVVVIAYSGCEFAIANN